ncbi:MAG: 2'-5' RNA ligase family protein [Steroidobacteraceae bacterium]|jgi:2'-5' RNA ligase|nr:2'-5' RNA ligase family protein [Steroidobacteraceae bacterium]
MSFVVTLGLDECTFALLDALRREHFPPARNFLPAHLTLFHQLPEDPAAAVEGTLAAAARGTASFPLVVGPPRPLGRGVALAVQAEALHALHRRLAEAFRPWLTRQDAQGFRPHVTVQNKADPASARASFERLRAEWSPHPGRGEALLLWRYLGGPWERVAEHRFGA